jgi:hypothetical protein
MSKLSRSQLRSVHLTPWEPSTRLCIAVLAVLACVFFSSILTGRAYLWEDFLYHDYPSRNFAAVSMAGGEIPLWNPYTFNGMPFLADIQKSVFYIPCAVLTLAVNNGTLHFFWLELMIILHYPLAGISMFFLARSFNLRRIPATIAGLAYMLSGFMIMHAIHQYIITLVAWFPLILLFFRRALTGSWKWTFACALVLGHSTLAGFPQLTLYLYYFLFVFFALEMTSTYGMKKLFSSPAFISAGKAAVVIILSVGVAMIQLLPTVEFSGLTFRAQITYAKSTEGEFSWIQLLTFLFPKIFGTAGAGGYQYYGPGTYWYYWETCMYLGILPLMLMSISAFLMRKNRYVTFFWTCGIFAILFALGDHFILHRLFFEFAPGFSTFRNPSRMGLFLAFSAAILSGFSLERILYEPMTLLSRQRMKGAVLVLSGIALLVYLLLISGALDAMLPFLPDPRIGPVIRKQTGLSLIVILVSGALVYALISGKTFIRWAGPALVVVLFLDLALFGGDQNDGTVNPLAYFGQARPLVDFIKKDSGGELVRVNMRNQQGMLMDRNQGLMDRIMLMEGYTPLVLKRYLPLGHDWSQICDMMNAKYRVATDEEHHTLRLERATTYLPRAYMIYDVRVIPDSASIAHFMQGIEFDPSRMAVAELNPGIPRGDSSSARDWHATFTSYSLNAMTLEVSTPRDGILVFSEVYYPGWKAFVDGTEEQIFRVNWNQRAIKIAKGTHTVSVRFESASYAHGMWLTVGTLAVCGTGFGLSIRRRKPLHHPEGT